MCLFFFENVEEIFTKNLLLIYHYNLNYFYITVIIRLFSMSYQVITIFYTLFTVYTYKNNSF